MLFYRNILSQNLFNLMVLCMLQNLFTYLPCCFIVTFCSQNLFTYLPCCFIVTFCHKFVHLPTMLFYRNILSQNLFIYLACCFIVTFCPKICSPTYLPWLKICSATYHAVFIVTFVTKCFHPSTILFLHKLLSQNLFTMLYRILCHKICSPTYHAVLS